MELSEGHRPRNLDWRRASAILYGDWGTSKAYVIGLAFLAAGFSSLPIILAVCALTGLVGLNYLVVCRCFPDGGGVYSAARTHGRLLAVIGALLLVADLTVTAALSGWAGLSYLGVPTKYIGISTIGMIFVLGMLNAYGPKHSGTLAVYLAAPTLVVVLSIIGLSAPHLSFTHLEAPHEQFDKLWVSFVGVILALSGVEAIANLTGVMKLDRGSTMDAPRVSKTSAKALLPVAIEVVFGTALLGWAMLSMPKELAPVIQERKEDMLRLLAEHYGALNFGPVFGQIFGIITGVVFALLLLSAVNTAVVAMIGLLFMMARDKEMPRFFTKLNRYGVPKIPLYIAIGLPVLVLLISSDFEALAGLYAIGVVGAIAVNLGSCTFNKALPIRWHERILMGFTFVVLFAVEITLARTKPDALFFVVCVLGIGLALRAWSLKTSGLASVTVAKEIAEMVTPEALARLEPRLAEGQKIMVAARGVTPVLRFALEEAHLRKAMLYVLYVREVAVFLPGGGVTKGAPKWRDDPNAAAIMTLMHRLGDERNVTVVPVYAASDDAAATILDLTATLGIECLIVGSSHRRTLTNLLKGNVVNQVALGLPEDIQLLIYG